MLPAAWLVALFSCGFGTAQDQPRLVRMANIQIDSAQLNRCDALLQKEIEAAIHSEPGVLPLHAVADKESPIHITVLDVHTHTDV